MPRHPKFCLVPRFPRHQAIVCSLARQNIGALNKKGFFLKELSLLPQARGVKLRKSAGASGPDKPMKLTCYEARRNWNMPRLRQPLCCIYKVGGSKDSTSGMRFGLGPVYYPSPSSKGPGITVRMPLACILSNGLSVPCGAAESSQARA